MKNNANENHIHEAIKEVGALMSEVMSKLRFSLSLRIALHYALQLMRTSLMILILLMLFLFSAHLYYFDQCVVPVLASVPSDGTAYDTQVLTGTLIADAYVIASDEISKEKGTFDGFFKDERKLVTVYHSFEDHVVVASISMQATWIFGWFMLLALMVMDLYRMLYFIRKQKRLNRSVLKPLEEITRTATMLSAHNLSDRIRVEGIKNELKDLAVVINRMLDRIELSYNSQKQFVSDASHELRTPIAVIQGYAGLLERWGKNDPDIMDEAIHAIAQEATSMHELVERLLFLARHDKKSLVLEMETFDPMEVVDEVYRGAKLLSTKHRFVCMPVKDVTMEGDKVLLKQLLRILMDNAIKYTKEGGEITIGAKWKENQCYFFVKDTGMGISADQLTRVFDRFYRCDSARKAETSGHGLGLSIARVIVSAHQGTMKVRSKLGVGTTFWAIFPQGETKEND